ncbi:MAG: ACP S-malonyltransferase [Rhodothermales bacterium]
MAAYEPQIMFTFPGQGSQYVGMGSDLCERYETARALYRQANEILGFDITRLSFEGPDEELTRTRHTQPALLTHAIACMEVFRELTDGAFAPAVAAGHSLGEYSALVASGALTFEQALLLVQKRGELMGEYGRGKMVAFKLELDTVRGFADRFYCGIGGCNLPEQTVVGGTEEDLEALQTYAESLGVKGIPLNTEGAFHTYLMITAAEAFRPALNAADIKSPACRVLSNYTGEYHEEDPSKIKAYLFFQLFNPVKWIWSVQRAITDGVNIVFEFGGGIGKGDGPASKRPNLQSITKRAFQGVDRHGLYFPAINVETIEDAARSMQRLALLEAPQPAGDAVLHLPLRNGVPTDEAYKALTAGARAVDNRSIALQLESAEENAAEVAKLAASDAPAKPEPYLTVGGDAAPLLGKPMIQALQDRVD